MLVTNLKEIYCGTKNKAINHLFGNFNRIVVDTEKQFKNHDLIAAKDNSGGIIVGYYRKIKDKKYLTFPYHTTPPIEINDAQILGMIVELIEIDLVEAA